MITKAFFLEKVSLAVIQMIVITVNLLSLHRSLLLNLLTKLSLFLGGRDFLCPFIYMGYSNGQLESEVQGGRGDNGDTGLQIMVILILMKF